MQGRQSTPLFAYWTLCCLLAASLVFQLEVFKQLLRQPRKYLFTRAWRSIFKRVRVFTELAEAGVVICRTDAGSRSRSKIWTTACIHGIGMCIEIGATAQQ